MSDMWIPAHTTVPPGAVARSAAGTSSPAGAKMIAASSGSGPSAIASPAHSAPRRHRQQLRLVVVRRA